MGKAVIVPIAMQRLLIEHAEREAPREAVGILGGCHGRAARVIELKNCAQDQHAFFADPYEQYLAEKSLSQAGFEVIALYHSHPGGGAAPSVADMEFSAAWDCAHVIVAMPLTGSARPQMRAYRWIDGKLFEVSLRTG